jgi:hypothetical protein
MTAEELDAIVSEKGIKVRAIDIRPYQYALPCQLGKNGNHVLNEICIRRWRQDGEGLTFMMDSHNFFFANPHDLIEVVPIPEDRYSPDFRAKALASDAQRMNRSRRPRKPGT